MGCTESKEAPPKAAQAKPAKQQQAAREAPLPAAEQKPAAEQQQDVKETAPVPTEKEEEEEREAAAAEKPAAVAPATPPPAAVVPVAPSGPTAEEEYGTLSAEVHNEYRECHGAPAVICDAELARHAQAQTDACMFAHKLSVGNCEEYEEGQNVYMAKWSGYEGKSTEEYIRQAIDSWYMEVDSYQEVDGGLAGLNNNAGHFTQVVWRDTKKVGLGVTRRDNMIMIAVNYYPAGNVDSDEAIRQQVMNVPGVSAAGLAKESAANDAGADSPTADPSTAEAMFGKVNVEAHNYFRKLHGAAEVTGCPSLAAHAQAQAEVCLAKEQMLHGNADEYNEGQNVFYAGWDGFDGNPTTDYVRRAVEAWYEEIDLYREVDGGMAGWENGAGHFTQVVWRDTTKVGLGVARGKNMIMIVVNYSPAGNVSLDEAFRQQVLEVDGVTPAKYLRDAVDHTQVVADLQDVAAKLHNDLREKHNAPALVASEALAARAQAQAEACLAKDEMHYGNNNADKDGQSLFCLKWSGYDGEPAEQYLARAVEKWYSEKDIYENCGGGKDADQAYNFTQIIWKDTKEVGLGMARRGDAIYIVVNYGPAGNIYDDEDWKANVEA